MNQQVASVTFHIIFIRYSHLSCFSSHIDPYNRRLIWTIIRKMKEAGKCIILTTHFLQEADVLSDRIAIMTSGRLQANGTPEFLKTQIGMLEIEAIHSSCISIYH
jgi:ABC-type multidrug transport system ATPase subunit